MKQFINSILRKAQKTAIGSFDTILADLKAPLARLEELIAHNNEVIKENENAKANLTSKKEAKIKDIEDKHSIATVQLTNESSNLKDEAERAAKVRNNLAVLLAIDPEPVK